jgi:5-methylcytosine-specific restriction endonuclease McrA
LTRAEISARHRSKRGPEQKQAARVYKREHYRKLSDGDKAEYLAKIRRRALEHIEAGLCYRCPERATHGIRCEKHFFVMFATNHRLFPVRDGAEMLRRIWVEQAGFCALSGVAMTTNTNRGPTSASLDHKIPRSKGGGNDRGNFQWVLYPLNVAKANHSVDDFVDLCRMVTAHTGGRVVALRKV